MISYAQYMGLLSGQTFIKYGCTFHLLAYNPDEDTQYRRDLGLVWMSGHCVWIQYSQGNHDVSFAICICDYKMHLVSLLRFSSSFSLFIDVYNCIWYIIICGIISERKLRIKCQMHRKLGTKAEDYKCQCKSN